jgi:hypothetical protein
MKSHVNTRLKLNTKNYEGQLKTILLSALEVAPQEDDSAKKSCNCDEYTALPGDNVSGDLICLMQSDVACQVCFVDERLMAEMTYMRSDTSVDLHV